MAGGQNWILHSKTGKKSLDSAESRRRKAKKQACKRRAGNFRCCSSPFLEGAIIMIERQSVATLIDASRPARLALGEAGDNIGHAARMPHSCEAGVPCVQDALAARIARHSAACSAGRVILRLGARVNVDTERSVARMMLDFLIARERRNAGAVGMRKSRMAGSILTGSDSAEHGENVTGLTGFGTTPRRSSWWWSTHGRAPG